MGNGRGEVVTHDDSIRGDGRETDACGDPLVRTPSLGCCPLRLGGWRFVGGLFAGIVLTVLTAWALMPGMMITTDESQLDFDETVTALTNRIEEQGWVVQRTLDVQESLRRHEQVIPFRVKLIKLCQPAYAADVLTTDRYVSALMPCSIAVWEDDQGQVFVSKMNTGLMGKIFGGNIAKVMGGSVAQDERAILDAVIR